MGQHFEGCGAGGEQSPIDLDEDEAVEVPVDKATTINYLPVTAVLVHTGHTIRADVSPGSEVVIDGTSYDLEEFHFHLPSEHTQEGEHTAMELHLVHKDKNDEVAVVGVWMEQRAGTSAFGDLFRRFPSEEGATEEITEAFDVTAFLPGDRDHYQYDGSLTTSPCTEGVEWTVFQEPVGVAPDEVAAYRKMFPKSNRPTQPLNGRVVTVVDE